MQASAASAYERAWKTCQPRLRMIPEVAVALAVSLSTVDAYVLENSIIKVHEFAPLSYDLKPATDFG